MDSLIFLEYLIMELICPKHQISLKLVGQDYICSNGCKFPIINKIPRFVPCENYAGSFGLQWNKFRKTQLDSYTGLNISEERLQRLAGGSLDIFNGKTILEAGCGAGRFTEIMLKSSGIVHAFDLSDAVEANYENCSHFNFFFIYQADICNLPFYTQQFDIVVCVGVIQHTPSPEDTIKNLCLNLKSGGILIIDHYTHGYPIGRTRRILRSFLLKRSRTFSMRFVSCITNILWPIHRITWKFRTKWVFKKFRYYLLKLSPLIDYQDSYPQLSKNLLYQWCLLDTHDTLTDYYKHLRSAEEIKQALINCGMTDIKVIYAGNGVEASAIKN